MLREHWNFHGDVAIELESVAQEFYGDIGRPYSKIYDAAAIESGSFVEVMLQLLREKTQRENNYPNIDAFAEECAPYLGKNGNDIPKEKAAELLAKFKDLFENA